MNQPRNLAKSVNIEQESAMSLVEAIESRRAQVGVIGLGYVGLPLVIEFCRAGFSVTGFDIDPGGK